MACQPLMDIKGFADIDQLSYGHGFFVWIM